MPSSVVSSAIWTISILLSSNFFKKSSLLSGGLPFFVPNPSVFLYAGSFFPYSQYTVFPFFLFCIQYHLSFIQNIKHLLKMFKMLNYIPLCTLKNPQNMQISSKSTEIYAIIFWSEFCILSNFDRTFLRFLQRRKQTDWRKQ